MRQSEARLQFAQKEEMIVAELRAGRSRTAEPRGFSSCFGTMAERQNAGRAASRRGGSSAAGIDSGLGCSGNFGGIFSFRGWGGRIYGKASFGLLFDANQALIRDLPTEVLVLAALLEVLLEEDGAAGIGDKDAGSGQKDIAGAVLHLHTTPEKRRVASHPVRSFRGG
jgi:hypothetical protein